MNRDKAITKYIKDHVSFMGFSKEQDKKFRKRLKEDLEFEFNKKNRDPHSMDRQNRIGKVKDNFDEKEML